jgi:hypothetical protein
MADNIQKIPIEEKIKKMHESISNFKNIQHTDEEIEELRKIITIRTEILRRIDSKRIIDIIKKIINNSEYIDFYSATAAKFIDPINPSFNLKVRLDDECLAKYPLKGKMTLENIKKAKGTKESEEFLNYSKEIVYKELLDPFYTEILELINQYKNEKFDLFLKDLKEPDLQNYFLSSICKIAVMDDGSKLINFKFMG